MTTTTPTTTYAPAVFSHDRRYRYILRRRTGMNERLCVFGMLNPSDADEERNDPTATRCIGFAQAWEFGWMWIVNAYALVETDPKQLWAADDPVGFHNDYFIELAAKRSDLFIAAWGANIKPERAERGLEIVRAAGAVPHALKLTRAGIPGHPLYLPKTAKPFALEKP